MLGVLDLADPEIEAKEAIADRIRRALAYVTPNRLVPAPDCGMKYLPRDVAFGKLKAMAEPQQSFEAKSASLCQMGPISEAVAANGHAAGAVTQVRPFATHSRQASA